MIPRTRGKMPSATIIGNLIEIAGRFFSMRIGGGWCSKASKGDRRIARHP
jgi:hypothetical protein